MKRTRRSPWLWFAAGIGAILTVAGATLAFQRSSIAQGGQTAISLNAPASFPVDI